MKTKPNIYFKTVVETNAVAFDNAINSFIEQQFEAGFDCVEVKPIADTQSQEFIAFLTFEKNGAKEV